jgi:hypothetical protein
MKVVRRTRGLLFAAVTLAAAALAALPAAVAVRLGWYHTLRVPGDVGRGSALIIVLVLFYMLWLPAVVVGLVYVYDRLGYHYAVSERTRPDSRRRRRRQRAGLQFLASRSAPAHDRRHAKRDEHGKE